MKAVILAGGAGKRVFPLAVNKPKPMFKLLGKPLIQHVIEILKANGLNDFVVVVGHGGEQIKEFFGDGKALGANITYTVQPEALGMANALETAKDLVEDHFLVVNADDLFEGSLVEKMLGKLKEGKAEIVLSCKPVEETWKFGIIKVEKDTVTNLTEKPSRGQEQSNLAVIGVYLVTKEIFGVLNQIPVSDHQYEDAIQKFIERGKVTAVSYEGFFAGYKYPWDLFRMNTFLMDSQIKKQKIEENVLISKTAIVEGNVWIKKGARILENAIIKGPCYIGESTIVGNNSLVRGYASIGDHCIVGFSAEIKSSLVGDNCFFHMNYIGDSIVLDNCLFGAGATTANFRFDEKNVSVLVDGRKVDSGTNKLGVIMGDYSRAGINSSLAPGVKVGPYSIVGAGVFLQNDLEPGKMILLDKKTTVVKDNTITLSQGESLKLATLLKKYRKAK